MVRVEKVDPSVLQSGYKRTKWQDVIDQFEREGHDIVRISESGRNVSAIQGCLNSALKKKRKSGNIDVQSYQQKLLSAEKGASGKWQVRILPGC